MKITQYKTGAWIVSEKSAGWYSVKLYRPNGELHDKVRCDTYRQAGEYKRAFDSIAKTL